MNKRHSFNRWLTRTKRKSKLRSDQTENRIDLIPNATGLSHDTNSSVAIIYKSELDYISRCILDYPNIETGGQLFGFWTAECIPIVLYAIGPGPNANHQTTFFNQDVDYLTRVGKPIVEHFGLQHIGEWHSHHQLGLAQPSSHDAHTMSSTIKEKHLRQFLLCIGNCTNSCSTLNAFNFSEFCTGYTHAQWCVKGIDSPFRKLIDDNLSPYLKHPATIQANITNIYSVESREIIPPEFKESYWFSIKENRQILKRIMDSLEHCSIQQDKDGYIHLIKQHDSYADTIFFPEGFPQQSPKITRRYTDNSVKELNASWQYSGNIYDDFINFYSKTYEL